MSDLYHEIYTGEIFQKSRCIWHENILLDFFRSNLIQLGYTSNSDSNKVWVKGNQTVVVCLVDDISTCNINYSTTMPYIFDKNTTVITDNYITCPTQYRVLQLPDSFFGIYSHTPEILTWTPERRFNFSVNRLDPKRMLMLLEIYYRAYEHHGSLDYVNFNCWSWDGDNSTAEGLVDNFKRQFNLLEPQFQDVYQDTFKQLLAQVPIRNHQYSQEQVHHRAWVNLVMETYSSDTAVALSEKIFRAMCLPVPWMLYCGKYAVAYLNKLGFDTLQDLVPHQYDNQQENRTAAYGDKMVDFVYAGNELMLDLQSRDWTALSERCQQAAAHNQQLLANMQQRWSGDFAQWWAQNSQLIA